jgi:hypothetical protein
MDWHDKAVELHTIGNEQGEKLGYKRIGKELGISPKTVESFLQRYKKKNVIYEDKKEYEETDVDYLFQKVIELQEAENKIDTKQVKANIRIPDNKPIAVAWWADWHLGAKGTDYRQFEEDREKIINTDGLYFIGGGDYKDNYISGTHTGGNFEQIVRPGLQDIFVKRQMELVADKCLALVRGCHDSWDKKQGDKDFLEAMCEVSNSVNMWHGGEITIKLGSENYLWRVRHKYTGKSNINFENSMRRLIETQGPCDVAAEAHLHNEYSMYRHICGAYRVLMRSGSYKVWDEHGQQLAGYKGKVGIPVVIMYPDKHHMVNFDNLEDAIIQLKALRSKY